MLVVIILVTGGAGVITGLAVHDIVGAAKRAWPANPLALIALALLGWVVLVAFGFALL